MTIQFWLSPLKKKKKKLNFSGLVAKKSFCAQRAIIDADHHMLYLVYSLLERNKRNNIFIVLQFLVEYTQWKLLAVHHTI